MQDVLPWNGSFVFDWHSKKDFDAAASVQRARHASYAKKDRRRTYEAWDRPAPDLRMQLFDPSPPPRNSREAIQPWKYTASFDGAEAPPPPAAGAERRMQLISLKLAGVGCSAPATRAAPAAKAPEFQTRVRVMNPWEAKIHYVKHGVNPMEKYHDPRPHDFRKYPKIETLGLPEFDVNFDKDPYLLKLRSKTLDVVHGLPKETLNERHGHQMGDDLLPPQPAWEADLLLPKGQYPVKSQATTRHRPMYRSAHSAFLSRVEERLVAQWEHEKDELRRSSREAKVTLRF